MLTTDYKTQYLEETDVSKLGWKEISQRHTMTYISTGYKYNGTPMTNNTQTMVSIIEWLSVVT